MEFERVIYTHKNYSVIKLEIYTSQAGKMAEEYDPEHPFLDPTIPFQSHDAPTISSTNELIDAVDMLFAECNSGNEDEDMVIAEADFSDDEQDGGSRKEQIQKTKDKTDTSEFGQLSEAMRKNYQERILTEVRGDPRNKAVVCATIDEINATARHVPTDKVLEVMDPENGKDPNMTSKPDIPAEMRLDGNLDAELESMTREEVIKKCKDLDAALNDKWRKQMDEDQALEMLGVIPAEEVTNRYAVSQLHMSLPGPFLSFSNLSQMHMSLPVLLPPCPRCICSSLSRFLSHLHIFSHLFLFLSQLIKKLNSPTQSFQCLWHSMKTNNLIYNLLFLMTGT